MILIRKTGEIHPMENQPWRAHNWLGEDWCELPAALLPKHNGGYCELVFEGDKLVDLIPTERPEPEPTVEDFKNQLAETDYRIIKSMEYQLAGLEPPYDIAVLHAERQAIRDKINELEGAKADEAND